MRTAAINKAPGANGAPPPSPSEDTFQLLPLYRISESEANPRKRFDPDKLQELAQSIRQHGVIEPVIVRRHTRPEALHDYELICGARRFRASEMAGQTRIPALIREMSDKDVLEVMCIENANREDVHPLEEGEAFLKLVQQHGSSVQQLAEKIGKSDRYVQRRLKLAALIPEAKEAYCEGRLTLEHYSVLARLEPASQGRALRQAWASDYSREGDEYGYFPVYDRPRTAKEFEGIVRAEFFLSLQSAPWDLMDANLDEAAGSCASCTKRTGASPLLFDEAEKTDHCLDAVCFDSKRKLYLIQAEKAAKKQGTPLVRVATSYISDADEKALKCLPSYGAYAKVSKSDRCPHTQRAVVVVGDNVGAQFDICANQKCKQHMGKPAGGSSSRSSALNAQADESRRKRDMVEAVADSLVKGILAKVPKKLGRREWLLIAGELASAGNLPEAAELVGLGDLPRPAGYQAAQDAFVSRLEACSEEDLGKAMVAMCLLAMKNDCYEELDERLAEAAKVFGLDAKAIEKTLTASFGKEEGTKARKKAAPVADAKRAAANDVEEDFEEDFDGSEEYADE